ncbi:metallophosphoesterase [Bremerella cremea]|uniref:Metallophosphoesterase n=1 Tax=Bremerella cremea TaxID=1031537 RepID=A0A368KUW3_9BACT|nr:metallophosphoesterase [Bremerella cremea]RCS54213.1 metallophosphoesterase [Bremerella cremea]
MKRALISDIHGNLEALNAVLDDIRQQGISEIYCLGDVIGYGPNPVECLDIVRRKCAMCLLGNHDQAALFDPEGFNPVAFRAILWTRDQIDNSSGGAGAVNERWDFLGELPRTHVEPNRLFVHGSPRDPTNEYVFPEDIYNQRKMENLFDRVEKFSFQGHTHIPGVFTPNLEFFGPDECDHEYRFGDEKALFNVGSVGQPRDGDPRACYVILTDESVVFRRVEYDPKVPAAKIYKIPQLDNMLGDRILEGR